MTTATTPSSPLAAERARERNVFSYYPQSLDIVDLRPRLESAPKRLPPEGHEPRPSKDAALVAFAQLGTHRLAASRAFISLIDSQSQIILAEATKTVSLGNTSIRAAEDPLWLGSAIIPRTFGACECTLEADHLVVNDLHQDDRFHGRPFVGAAPNLRFYAGVPLRTPQGIPIGVYCVVDDQPRDGLDDQGLFFMQDVAATVVSYLSAVQAFDANRKAEQMIRGLTSFVTGAADIQRSDELDVPRKAQRPSAPSPAHSPHQHPEPKEASPTTPRGTQDDRDDDEDDADTALPHDDLLSPGTKRMFSRAANIMRESSDLNGVIFFDASVANSSPSAEGPSSPSTEESDDASAHHQVDESSGSTASSYADSRHPTCRILGFADAGRSSRHGAVARKDYLGLTEDSLRRLLKRHPHGKIFNIERQSTDNIPMKQTRKGRARRSTAVEAIVDVAHNARSAAIIPLWDYERQRWFAGCLCWSSKPNRQLSYGSDLLYLRAFGHSIMAELGRIDSIALDKAKTSFIESMSHELRSPLHGILGGVEYLLEMHLDTFQTSIVNSIAMCGRTLLDTVQNVLEYSKINEFTGPYAKSSKSESLKPVRPSHAPPSTAPSVNICRLTEETVEAVFAGQSYNMASHPSATDDNDSFLSSGPSPSSQSQSRPELYPRKAIRLILDLPVRPCWTFAIQPAIWRRILMNVFGNALRFTDAGFVRVSLAAQDVNDQESEITLTIVDSGSGMSSNYIKDGLFKPFSQEDPFSPGTGLGMSIVQRLVNNLGGEVSVESRVGVGTTIKIHVVLSRREDSTDSITSRVFSRTNGMRVAVAGPMIPEDDPNHALACQSEFQFHGSLTDSLKAWFGIDVVPLDDINADSSQMIMYPWPSFNLMFKPRSRKGVSMVVAMDGMEASTLRADERVTSQWIDVVTQPCGPSKLTKIFERYLSLLNSNSEAPTQRENKSSPLPETAPYAPIIRSPFSRQQALEEDARSSKEGAPSPTPAPAESRIPELELPPTSVSTETTNSIPSAHTVAETAPSQTSHPHQLHTDRRESRAKADETTTPTAPPRSGNEILIVDDNALNLRLLSAFLNKAGFKNHTSAANGLEAVNLYKKDPSRWAAVLMDLSMPVMDGVTATREIRAWEKRNGIGDEGGNGKGDKADLERRGLKRVSTNGYVEDTPPRRRGGDEESAKKEKEQEHAGEHPAPPAAPPPESSGPSIEELKREGESANEQAEENSLSESAPRQQVPSPSTSQSAAEKTSPTEDKKQPEKSSVPSSSSSSASNSPQAAADSTNNGKEAVHIIVITGLGSAAARYEATSAGADVFMTKPIQFGALMKTLKGRFGKQDEAGKGTKS
ncbi:Oxidative stress response two-component system protein SSK1 [Lasiodiplodia theobromae]|uniref:histidine kinase n=1 Tax=Lasiodiplodia theobromae TaxID=45133 RepID=A0A5N5DTK9_9PEZI|nr:Oxidative stress response two-component system protein SSK1 [Lasiodiplodia theobromae]